MLIMLTVITSDSSDQSDHFKTLITQWLFNHCCYIILCKKVLTLRLLIDNDLKRKQKRSTNESHLLSIIITFKNTILNHLIKKSKTNELKSISITSISVSFSFKNLTREINILQMLKKTSNSLKCKL